MSVSSVADNGPGRRVIAEVPVVLQPHQNRNGKQKSPQQKLDEFWKRFTTEAPGKGECVLVSRMLAASFIYPNPVEI
jgi:hypothetical protein